MSLPTAFKDFRKIDYIRQHIKEKRQLIRFAYRYRLAYCFTSSNALGVGTTLIGYDAIHKVFLAYTAYEQLLKSTTSLDLLETKPIKFNKVNNLDLANRLREQKYVIEVLIKYTVDANILKQIIEFKNNNSNDIICIGYALRNVYAHGDLTPSPMKLRKEEQAELLYDLADFLLEYCDEIFTKVIDKLR